MNAEILCLSGWAQKPESLEPIFHNFSKNIKSLDYSQFGSNKAFFDFAAQYANPEILIGWSLGGQLAARLVAGGIFNPQLLVLIAAPFEFVKSPRVMAGMPQRTYQEFHDNFAKAPDGTLKKFAILTMMNDKNSRELFENLEITEQNHQKLLFWLEELARFSCFDLDFANFPRTLIIQGAGDVVVHMSQAEIFAKKIPDCQLEILKNCGHAPHFSNLEKLQSLITKF